MSDSIASSVALLSFTWALDVGLQKSQKGFYANVAGLLQFRNRWLLTINIYLQ
jgi:hypothetical protein